MQFQFLASSQNSKIFVAHYSADINLSRPRQAVILIPPFGEEMNRAKRMYVLCARLLANAGIDAIVFDYIGTGDSYGEWGEFGFNDWVANVLDVYRYVQDKDINDISLLALRFGALTAAEFITKNNVAINKCILWDPVESGEMFMRQLIRIKIAAAMAEASEKINTKQVLAEIQQAGHTEIGGYQITQSLLDAVNNLKLANAIQELSSKTEMHWMVLGKPSESNSIDPLPNSVPEDLLDQIRFHSLSETRFWMQQEVTISPALLRHTRNIF